MDCAFDLNRLVRMNGRRFGSHQLALHYDRQGVKKPSDEVTIGVGFPAIQ